MESLFLSLLIVTALLVSLGQGNPLTWTRLSADGPRSRGSAFAYDSASNSLILFGGLSSSDNSTTSGDDTWIYDLSTNTWRISSAATSPSNRIYTYFGLIRVNSSSLLVVTHGIAGTIEYEDVWVFDVSRETWYQPTITGSGPGYRYGGHFGAHGNALWVGSGFTKYTSLWSRYIDTYRLVFTEPNVAYWETVHPQPTSGNQFNPLVPHGRCLQSSSVLDQDMLVMWGGCMRGGNGGGPCPAEDGWVFDNSNKKWTELPRCATPRVFSGMAPLSNDTGKAVLYGGSDKFSDQVITDVDWPEDEVLIVDAQTKSWTRYLVETSSGVYPARRFAHVMTAGPNGAIYMFGGAAMANASKMNDLWILQGDPSLTKTADCDRIWFSFPHLHGFFMIIAFGILFPSGALIVRYYRCKGSKVWFILHVTVQVTAALFSIAAFIMIFPTGGVPSHPHAIIGIFLMTFMIIQIGLGIFRPHIKEGKEKTKYRKVWEWCHRIWGTFVVVLGLTQVTLGVFLIVPPLGVWVVWILMLVTWVVVFIVNEIIKWVCICCKKPDATEEKGMEMKTKN